ncbi:MAG: bifunctional adenosylcobinamide kinase/adenosylcobinamide-phosphate guanylyltransferase [Lachnospiraceae bacterium]
MVLVVGGAFQGKKEYVKNNYNQEYALIDNYHLLIRQQMTEGKDPLKEAVSLVKKNAGRKLIIICDEVGCGVVPMEAFERRYREMVGRICCYFAGEASEVIRVVAGIGTRIKADE